MAPDERQFLFTIAWLFVRHGQAARARTICEALIEDDPKDGVAAVALADMLLGEREAEAALAVLRNAACPAKLERAEALLETRALSMMGRKEEGAKRWRRYVAASQGARRNWVDG